MIHVWYKIGNPSVWMFKVWECDRIASRFSDTWEPEEAIQSETKDSK
jgi:hypothetical protein